MAKAEDGEKTDPALSAPPKAPGSRKNFGAIDALMADPKITEIMINDFRNVIVEREGKLMSSGLAFRKADDLRRLVALLLEGTGAELSPQHPYADLILFDGSRVNIVVPPVAPSGPCITIRKFPHRRMEMEDLLSQGMLDSRMAGFLSACVLGKLNLMISGGTGTGKTTLLNALAGNIPAGERVVTIEDTPELVLRHPNSVKMISQQASAGLAGVSARELVTNSLRMRPDRIIVGECRTGEAFDMLQAMNTGHQGSMTTIHANTPRDALSRLETLCLLSGSGSELPLIALRKQMKSALDLVIQLKRSRTGKRRIVAISELTGLEGDVITMQDIYLFASESPSGDEGVFKGTGFVPTFVEKLRDQGVELPAGYFA